MFDYYNSEPNGFNYYINPDQFADTEKGDLCAFSPLADEFYETRHEAVAAAKALAAVYCLPVTVQEWTLDGNGKPYEEYDDFEVSA